MDKTSDRARGRWREILPQLGVSSKFLKRGRGACPACGGGARSDRFTFDDRTKNGDYFCRSCGAGKGISLVMKVNGWDFRTAAKEVDRVLGHVRDPRGGKIVLDRAHRTARKFFDSCPDLPPPWEPDKSTREATMWLLKNYKHPQEVRDWLDTHDPMLELWLTRNHSGG